MLIDSIIKVLKNRTLLSIAVDMCIAYLFIVLKYAMHIGGKVFLTTPLDNDFFIIPLKMFLFYLALPLSILSILNAKFIFDLLCLLSRNFLGDKVNSVRNYILKNKCSSLQLKRFSMPYTLRLLKNIVYTCSILIFSAAYAFVLDTYFDYGVEYKAISIVSMAITFLLYCCIFIVITRNYFTSLAIKDISNGTFTDAYQSLRDIFR